jgi:hypothetical protein
MPRSLLGRLIVRILAFELLASLALILTTVALVFAFARRWGLAAVGGLAAAATWAYVVRDEMQARREQRSLPYRWREPGG